MPWKKSMNRLCNLASQSSDGLAVKSQQNATLIHSGTITHLDALESYAFRIWRGVATSIVVCMTFSRSSLTRCRSASMLSTVGGDFRRCSSKASLSIRNRLVLTLNPTISGVRPRGCGRIPAEVMKSSSTSVGRRSACSVRTRTRKG